MVQLSEGTRQRLRRLFRAEDAAEAERLLIAGCGDNLQIGEAATPISLERFRYAGGVRIEASQSRLRRIE